MDLADPLRTLCPDPHGRVLGVLARADRALTRSQIASGAELTSHGVSRAVDDLVAGGLVWRTKVASNRHWHVLYREHLAADFVLALAHLDRLLARRVIDRVETWQPPAEAVALRLPCPDPPDDSGSGPPCPDVAAHSPPAATLDLLVVRPRLGHEAPWHEQATDLVESMRHWTGNPVHLQLCDTADAATSDRHDRAAAWWLLAGTAPPGLPTRRPDAPPDQQITPPDLHLPDAP